MTDDAFDHQDIDGLAAEHVLGSLTQAERAEVQRRLPADRRLAEVVAEWERRLTPLSHREPGMAPPPRALEAILAGVAREAGGAQTAAVVQLRRSVGRWRVAATISALAAALALVVPLVRDARSPVMHYAVLTAVPSDAADEAAMSGRPLFLATANPGRDTIALRQVSGRQPPGERVYVLWLAAREGRPARRIGALERGEPLRSFTAVGDAEEGAVVLVTSEQQPLPEAPTGPVVASGKLAVSKP